MIVAAVYDRRICGPRRSEWIGHSPWHAVVPRLRGERSARAARLAGNAGRLQCVLLQTFFGAAF